MKNLRFLIGFIPLLGLPLRAEHQVDILIEDLPIGVQLESLEAGITVEGSPGDYSAWITDEPAGQPPAYQCLFQLDEQIEQASPINHMTLTIDCDGEEIDDTVFYPDNTVFYIPGPPMPPAEPTVFPEIAEIDSCGVTHIAADALPTRFGLLDNRPNPFNPMTRIRFALSGPAETRLEIFDIRGGRVARLIDGQLPAGQHSVNFDASRLSGGVYFVVLKTDTQGMDAAKILLLK